MSVAENTQLLAQAIALYFEFVWAVVRASWYIPYAIAVIVVRRVLQLKQPIDNALFYKGIVIHSRNRPKENSFTYLLRMAVIELDNPPHWWTTGKKDSMTAAQARQLAGTKGSVKLLTNPTAAGYYMNPISVYYCYTLPINGTLPRLERCIAEVTNTPWGERVTFLFDPNSGSAGAEVPKALHVSPFMDMKNIWTIKANDPGKKLEVSVAAKHPDLGPYFIATLKCTVDEEAPHTRNELASFSTLKKYGFQPHRVAFWIYLQAVYLAYKGVAFYSPPGKEYQDEVVEKAEKQPRMSDGKRFAWRDALGWPWTS